MRASWLAFAAVGLLPVRTAAQLDPRLRERLAQRIAESGARVGLYFRDLQQPDSILIEPDLVMHAASTMKVPVMIQVFRERDAGRLGLDERLRITNEFRSIADGSTYRLDPSDDSDSSLYRLAGRSATVRDLVDLMITVSSNLATNILVERVRPESVQATMHGIGADSMRVLRGVEDGAAFRAGLNNTTSARALGQILSALTDGRAATPWSCGQMLEILSAQRSREGIPAGLPRRTRVAHKTGEITAHHHDAGVVYLRGRPRYVLVVLTQGLEERARSAALIADLTRLVHEAVVGHPGR